MLEDTSKQRRISTVVAGWTRVETNVRARDIRKTVSRYKNEAGEGPSAPGRTPYLLFAAASLLWLLFCGVQAPRFVPCGLLLSFQAQLLAAASLISFFCFGECKLSGTFPCSLSAASRPSRPLRLTMTPRIKTVTRIMAGNVSCRGEFEELNMIATSRRMSWTDIPLYWT